MRAIGLYREALALDPDFALAWRGLFNAQQNTLVFAPENSVAARKEMAEASAHIEALAPDAWWTQTMRALQFMIQHKWSQAMTAASAALAAALASESGAAATYAGMLAAVGRNKEAAEVYLRVRQADPLSLGVSGLTQYLLDIAGRREDAQAEYERSKDLSGNRANWDWFAVFRLWSRKDADPAAVKAQFRIALEQASRAMALEHILVDILDKPKAARAAIRQAFDDPAYQDPTRIAFIAVYADHFGDKDLALAAMRREYIDLNGVSLASLWWPYETGLRADARFKELLRDMGLADYFRESGNWGDFCRPLGRDDFECR
jgi:tetratricopeptide (TPR) repeat protein